MGFDVITHGQTIFVQVSLYGVMYDLIQKLYGWDRMPNAYKCIGSSYCFKYKQKKSVVIWVAGLN